MGLKSKTKALFYDAIRMCESCAGGETIKNELQRMLGRIDEPLRVAVVGVMKAGKSTLLNALMREPILITGTLETTYTVSWFRYGEKPTLTVVLRDGTTVDDDFSRLDFWTVRDKLKENPRLNDVQYIIIRYPNEVLKRMELIDTPGLLSTHVTDSKNTLDFLGLDRKSDEVTRQEASQADAIVYAFTRGLQQSNAELLRSFHGAAASTPINAVGVLTQADLFWDTRNDPMQTAASVVENIMGEPQVQSLLYTTLPVTAKLVESVQKLEDRHWAVLSRLAGLDAQALSEMLRDKSVFCNLSENDLAEGFGVEAGKERCLCDAGERREVCSLLGQFGVHCVTGALRGGKTPQECVAYLYGASGMDKLTATILQHFGNRSMLIKLRYVYSHLKQVCASAALGASPGIREVCEFIANEIDNLETTEQAFRELDVLQSYYNGQLKLGSGDELQEILRLTGEQGMHCEARLNAPKGASIQELAELSKTRALQWNARANSGVNTDRRYIQAATILARSCDIIHFHLQELLGAEN